MSVADALLAIHASDPARAVDAARAASAGGSVLGAELLAHLEASAAGAVYDDPAAFEAFISGGGNVALYDRTIAFVRATQARAGPRSVLDIGCGDGRVTAAAAASTVERIDLVEPSEALLAEAVGRFEGTQIDVHAHGMAIEDHLAGRQAGTRWDLGQATFSLHSLPPALRVTVFRALAQRLDRLVIVEFDVPELHDGSPEHAGYAAERYERGIAEYPDDPAVVTGFLLPVLLGQFDPARPRLTFEHSAERWTGQLAEAGWTVVEQRELCDYWWAPVFGVEAVPSSG